MHGSGKGYKGSGTRGTKKTTGNSSKPGRGSKFRLLVLSDLIPVHFAQPRSLTSSIIGRNMKELFIKKLHICTKTYDYNDETKDVKGKVSDLLTIAERENQCHFRVARASPRTEVRDEPHHPQLRRGDADDREEHLQASPQRKERRTCLLRDWNRARRGG